MRVAIIGGPKTGKSTLARKLTAAPLHADDAQSLGWSQQSDEVAKWFDRPDAEVIEGTATVRGLRKWIKAHPEGKPVDEIIYLDDPLSERNDGQERMARSHDTILNEIRPELERRGVRFRTRPRV